MQVGITLLFKWQLYVTPNRLSPIFKSSPVSGFHDTRAASGHGRKTQLCNSLSKLNRLLVVGVIFFKPGRSKYGYTGPDKMQRSKPFNKLFENFKGKR